MRWTLVLAVGVVERVRLNTTLLQCPRVGLEPTGNGVEIEDCSASAVVSKGTVPPGMNLPTSNLESGRPTVKALKILK